jgi:hypothetical protein
MSNACRRWPRVARLTRTQTRPPTYSTRRLTKTSCSSLSPSLSLSLSLSLSFTQRCSFAYGGGGKKEDWHSSLFCSTSGRAGPLSRHNALRACVRKGVHARNANMCNQRPSAIVPDVNARLPSLDCCQICRLLEQCSPLVCVSSSCL